MSTKAQLATDIVQFALDIVGIVDPTGVADGISALMSLGRGKWLDAAISGISMVPYIGDLAKTAKLPKYADSIRKAIRLASRDYKFAAELVPALQQLKKSLDKVPLGQLPDVAKSGFMAIRREVDDFLKNTRLYNPNPKHELSGALGKKGSRLDLTADQAFSLLNDRRSCLTVPGKKQLVAVKDRKIYVFQPDNMGSYHAYPVTGKEIAANYSSVATRVATMLGTNVKRLSRME